MDIQNQPWNKLLVALIIFVVLVLLVVLSYYLFIQQPRQTTPERTGIFISETLEPTIVAPTQTQAWTHCEKEISCILQIVDRCQQGDFLVEKLREIVGEINFVEYRFTLLGLDDQECIFEIQTESVEVSYSSLAYRNLRDMGFTAIEIDSLASDKGQKLINNSFNASCRGDPEDLSALITSNESGFLSTYDWSQFDCNDNYSLVDRPTPNPMETATPTIDPYAPELQPGSGENLVGNSSFEINPNTLWPTWVEEWNNTDMRVSWTDEEQVSGQYSMMITATTGYVVKPPGMYYSSLIPVESGEMIGFDIWATSPDGAGAMISVDLYDSEMNYLHTSSTKCERFEPYRWRRVSIGILLGGDASYARPGYQICIYQAPKLGGPHVYFDDVYFGITNQ
jgi:hypothetical protein